MAASGGMWTKQAAGGVTKMVFVPKEQVAGYQGGQGLPTTIAFGATTLQGTAYGGLVVHAAKQPGQYAITHAATGKTIGHVPSAAEAQKIAKALQADALWAGIVNNPNATPDDLAAAHDHIYTLKGAPQKVGLADLVQAIGKKEVATNPFALPQDGISGQVSDPKGWSGEAAAPTFGSQYDQPAAWAYTGLAPIEASIYGKWDIEMGACVNAQTGAVIFQKKGNPPNPAKGQGGSVSFTPAMLHAAKDQVLTHSHPKGGGLSPEDMNVALIANAMEQRAVGKTTDGKVYAYVVRRPATGWGFSKEQWWAEYKQASKASHAALQAAGASPNAHWMAHYHNVYVELSKKLGFGYQRILVSDKGVPVGTVSTTKDIVS